MKKTIVFALLVALCFGVNFAQASATPLEAPITLEEVETRFGNTFTVGDKIFSGFEVTSNAFDSGALILDKSAIKVQAFIIDDLNISLQFTMAGFQVASGQASDLFVSFMVEVSPQYPDMYIKDVGMRLNGATATGTGSVVANEQVTVGGPSHDLNSVIVADLDVSKQDDILLDQLTDLAEFDPVKKIWITKDIGISAGTAGSAALSGFVQSFSQIPEPMTLSLLGLGSLGLLCRRRF